MKHILVLFIGIVLTWTAYSNETNIADTVELQPMVISARGYESPIDTIPGGIGILTSEDIELFAPASIPNILEYVPGVTKRSDSAWGSDINIRGMSHDDIVFLIDDCRLITATDLNAQFGLVMPQSIEKVEILKGPISALYGSGTIGGIVNIITKNGYFSQEPAVNGNFFMGFDSNPGGMTTYGNLSYNDEKFYLFVSGGTRNYSSYEDGSGTKMTNSQYQDYETSVKAGFKENEENYTEAQIQYYKGTDIGIPGSDAPFPATALVTYPDIHRQLYELKHTYAPEGDIFQQMSINAFYQFNDRNVDVELQPATTVKLINPSADHSLYGSRWENILIINQHTINTGLEFWDRSYEGTRTKYLVSGKEITDKPLPDAYMISAGAFAEDTWNISEVFEINFGGRADYVYTDNDETPQYSSGHSDDVSWNAHIGSSYKILEGLSLNGIVASGYRVPTLTELYKYITLGGGITKWGNPDLEPEQSIFCELDLHYATELLDITLSGFYNNLDNLITDVKVDDTTYINENIAKAEIYGAELEANLYFDDMGVIFGNISYAHGKDTDTDEYLPSIAPLNGLIGVKTAEFNGFWGLFQISWAAKQDKTPANVDEADAWATADIRIGYNIEQNNSINKFYIGVDNLFDETYSEYLTASRGFVFNEPGRNFVMGYELQF